MKTPIQQLYDDVMSQKENRLQYYLDLEKEHFISAFMSFDSKPSRQEAELYFNLKYDNKRQETTTIRPDIPE